MAFRSLASRLRLPSTTECEADAGALNTLESVHETESFPVPGHLEAETQVAVDGVNQPQDGERKGLLDHESCSVNVGDEHMSVHGMETMPLSPPPSQRPIRQLSDLLSPPPRRAPAPPVGIVAQYCTELKHLLRAGGPVIVSSSLTQLLTMVDISFVGLWLGPAAMAAASTAKCGLQHGAGACNSCSPSYRLSNTNRSKASASIVLQAHAVQSSTSQDGFICIFCHRGHLIAQWTEAAISTDTFRHSGG